MSSSSCSGCGDSFNLWANTLTLTLSGGGSSCTGTFTLTRVNDITWQYTRNSVVGLGCVGIGPYSIIYTLACATDELIFYLDVIDEGASSAICAVQTIVTGNPCCSGCCGRIELTGTIIDLDCDTCCNGSISLVTITGSCVESSSSSSECDNLKLFETKYECINGILQYYRRPVTITIGNWIFDREEGCCDYDVMTIDCCENQISRGLELNIISTECPCVNNKSTILFNSNNFPNGIWTDAEPLMICGYEFFITLSCLSGSFKLSLISLDYPNCLKGITNISPTDNFCDPFYLSWAITLPLDDVCCPNLEIIISITEK